MIQKPFEYVGDELDLFAEARNWKRYWSRMVSPYVGKTVLDVGAGIGATARLLAGPSIERWLALEPDPSLAERMRTHLAAGGLPASCEIRVGVVADLGTSEMFDTVIYADVLEHIEDDRAELERAARHLVTGGHIIVLSPAHQWLFTPFDTALGHFRRYNRATLKAIGPSGAELVRLIYLDSAGVLASGANRLLLRSAHPTSRQIKTWDSVLVPISRVVDPILGHAAGKSIVAIWEKA